MKKIVGALYLTLVIYNTSFAQPFTRADTLRGSNGPGRSWWDATKYDLHVTFNLQDSTITGYNIIDFKVLKSENEMQIDLQDPMIIDSIIFYKPDVGYPGKVYVKDKALNSRDEISKDGNAYFIKVPHSNDRRLTIYYHGKPTIAKKAPWDGGLVWARDKAKNPWVSVACQGLGASVWYPCKDIQSDEPDSAEMHITIPDSLVAVGNGRFMGKTNNSDG